MQINNEIPNEYLEAFLKWYRPQISILKILHQDFERESKTRIDWNTFCAHMFRECRDGIVAAEILLRRK